MQGADYMKYAGHDLHEECRRELHEVEESIGKKNAGYELHEESKARITVQGTNYTKNAGHEYTKWKNLSDKEIMHELYELRSLLDNNSSVSYL